MAAKPKRRAPTRFDQHHKDAVDRIMVDIIEGSTAAGGDTGDMMELLASVVACALLNLFRADDAQEAFTRFSVMVPIRIEQVRAQNAELLAEMDAASRRAMN